MLGNGSGLLSGEVEMDETYFGSRKPGKRGRGAAGKTSVFGMVQRKGNVKAIVTGDLKRTTLYPIVKEHILPKSMIYTDEYYAYRGLPQEDMVIKECVMLRKFMYPVMSIPIR